MRVRGVAVLTAIAAAWGYAVFQYGGVVVWDRKVFLLALGIAGLCYWLVERAQWVRVTGVLGWTVWLLPAWVALQLVPLPAGLLSVLSPARAELLRAFQVLAPNERFATLSVVPGVTMNHFLLVCGYALVFLLLYQLGAAECNGRWKLVLPLLIAAGCEGVLGIVQGFSGQEASGTYVNRDHYAGLLEMALPFSLAYAVFVWRSLDRPREFPLRPALRICAALGLGAILLVGVLQSLSRMGFIAALFSVLVMGVAARGRAGRRFALAIALLVLVLSACFIFLPSDQLIARFADLSSGEQITAQDRVLLWGESLRVFRAFPVFGCGLGSFESAFLRYKVSDPMVADNRVHNDYLQFLIELGVIGFVIGSAMFSSIVARAWRAASPNSRPETRFLALGCLGAFGAIGLHSLVDFNLYVPANAMMLAWISGVAAALPRRGRGLTGGGDSGRPVTIDVEREQLPSPRRDERPR